MVPGAKLSQKFSYFTNFIYLSIYLYIYLCVFQEEQLWYYLTHSWEDKWVHTFPKGICPKVNVIARLEYELAYYDWHK